MDENELLIEYIRAIENPDKVGWNGRIWVAPNLKGYDKNNRGYGIDVIRNNAARKLTQKRVGRWLTDDEMNKLMNDHISYIQNAAQEHILNFDTLSPQRKAALLGMLYRGDSVNDAIRKGYINLEENDDKLFFDSIGNYYRTKGLNERANNSDKFFEARRLSDKIEFPKNLKFDSSMLVVPQDNTRVSRLEYIPTIKRKNVPQLIPWGGPEPQTFGGHSSIMKKGGRIKQITVNAK